MNDEKKQAWSQAWSFLERMTTQIMTLATGTIVLTTTLIDRVFPIATATCMERVTLVASWVVLGVSVLSGILVYMRSTGLLGRRKEEKQGGEKQDEVTVYETWLRLCSLLQLSTFFVGIALFVAYVSLNLFN